MKSLSLLLCCSIYSYISRIFSGRNRACLLTRSIICSSVRCLSGIRLSFAIVLTSRTCVHICGLPAGSPGKKLFTSTTVLVLRINKLINRSECTRAEKKECVYVAHACLNDISQIESNVLM